jgi:hypothetical protein
VRVLSSADATVEVLQQVLCSSDDTRSAFLCITVLQALGTIDCLCMAAGNHDADADDDDDSRRCCC